MSMSILGQAIYAEAKHVSDMMDRGSKPCAFSFAADGAHDWVEEHSKWVRSRTFKRCRKCDALEPPKGWA